MQFPIKTLTLAIIALGLTACGGSSGGSKSSASSSSSSANSSSLSSSIVSSSSLSSSSSSMSSSSTSPVESTLATSHPSVAEIKDCGLNITKPDSYLLFSDYDLNTQNQQLGNDFSGWNHTATPNGAEWANLKHSAAIYSFSNTAVANQDCNNVDTLNMVLVKKIADWDRQHANGFEKTIALDSKKFGDIENLVVDLKINSDKTSIPTLTYLKDTYVPTYVDEKTVVALENGNVNIGITIYDSGTDTVLSASRIIELEQATLADKWIRITIPMADFKLCSTKDYTCTSKTLADLGSTVIKGIRFVAETNSGAVLRNTINEVSIWSSTTPETFKEVDLSIKKIEFQSK